MRAQHDHKTIAAAKSKVDEKSDHRLTIMQWSADIFSQDSSHWHAPFAEIDVRTAMLGEWMTSSSQEKNDRALVMVHYTKCWQALHSIATGVKKPDHADTVTIIATYNAMKRLNLAHMLTEGLSAEVVEWLKHVVESSLER